MEENIVSKEEMLVTIFFSVFLKESFHKVDDSRVVW